jgi:hypothetical protein
MPAGSSPFIGSSRISSSGSPSRQRATPRRWRMPSEYVLTWSSARAARPTRASAPSIRARRAARRAAWTLQVLAAGEVRVEARLLDDRAHTGERRGAPAGQVAAEDAHAAARWAGRGRAAAG